MTDTAIDWLDGLRAQARTFLAAGYPALAGIDDDAFLDLAEAAIARAEQATGGTLPVPAHPWPDEPRLPALLVVTSALIAPEPRVPLTRLAGKAKPGFVDKNHYSDAVEGLAPYRPRPETGVPDAPLYVALDVARGDAFRGRAPVDAMTALAEQGRTGLTIDEGISLLTVAPEVLVKNYCFMLTGSTRGDKRVPALWIAEGAPKLGWCFDRVPHSWLGVASAAARV